jgi:integrase
MFRADYAKNKETGNPPLSLPIAEMLWHERQTRGSELNSRVFPNEKGDGALTYAVLSDLLKEVETHAGLPPLDGGRFHPYRRKFATERKHLPHMTVMKLMGLKNLKVFLESYALVSDEDMRTALANPVRSNDASLEKSPARATFKRSDDRSPASR